MQSKEQLSRIHSVIQADKSVMSDACKTLVLKDFADEFAKALEELDDIINQTEFKIETFYKNGGDNNNKWLIYVLHKYSQNDIINSYDKLIISFQITGGRI